MKNITGRCILKGSVLNLLKKINRKKTHHMEQNIINIYQKRPGSKVQGDLKKVSVIIPNYNYERYLIERIDSILFQTYPIYELIILDDCSNDNSLEVITKKMGEIPKTIRTRLIKNPVNSGSVFAQWKKAFQMADGDYVWIAEADDSCSHLFLETVMKGFQDEEVVLSYCESLTMDENNVLLMTDLREWIDIFNCGKWNKDYVNDGKQEIAETMCINNTIANVSSVVFKNDDYSDILDGARQYKLAGDWYVYLNILKRGKISYFHESLNYHRMQQSGVTLSMNPKEEFAEIVSLQDFAMNCFTISKETRKKIFQRREGVKCRLGL